MNPYPLVGLNHFTVPVAMRRLLALCAQVNCPCLGCAMQQIRVLADDLRATQRELGKADQKLGPRLYNREGNGSITSICKCARSNLKSSRVPGYENCRRDSNSHHRPALARFLVPAKGRNKPLAKAAQGAHIEIIIGKGFERR